MASRVTRRHVRPIHEYYLQWIAATVLTVVIGGNDEKSHSEPAKAEHWGSGCVRVDAVRVRSTFGICKFHGNDLGSRGVRRKSTTEYRDMFLKILQGSAMWPYFFHTTVVGDVQLGLAVSAYMHTAFAAHKMSGWISGSEEANLMLSPTSIAKVGGATQFEFVVPAPVAPSPLTLSRKSSA
ncbi:hypothetical protein BDN72DRAFT_902733 [Pluteus cervinus]|uniref:Uncharacterized protein n=1 Tax=Pluteus cervinus TaxID=181527 RepID=A0ACD3AAV6_9AGAR|nr:hypothetical protein BDN72DRAFT_902733 [Pluteus cervinus]